MPRVITFHDVVVTVKSTGGDGVATAETIAAALADILPSTFEVDLTEGDPERGDEEDTETWEITDAEVGESVTITDED
jgi:hypothetical protein